MQSAFSFPCYRFIWHICIYSSQLAHLSSLIAYSISLWQIPNSFQACKLVWTNLSCMLVLVLVPPLWPRLPWLPPLCVFSNQLIAVIPVSWLVWQPSWTFLLYFTILSTLTIPIAPLCCKLGIQSCSMLSAKIQRWLRTYWEETKITYCAQQG